MQQGHNGYTYDMEKGICGSYSEASYHKPEKQIIQYIWNRMEVTKTK